MTTTLRVNQLFAGAPDDLPKVATFQLTSHGFTLCRVDAYVLGFVNAQAKFEQTSL
jgi:hypothetical protein